MTGEPPGADRDLGAGRGHKWGGERTRERKQAQARGTGRRDEQRELAYGGCSKRLGGRCTAPGEDVGSGCDREVLRRLTATDRGGGGVLSNDVSLKRKVLSNDGSLPYVGYDVSLKRKVLSNDVC